MSKIVLFYVNNDEVKVTTVRGQAFIFVGNVMRSFSEEQICDFINEGSKNNGYHYNSVSGEYEFWNSGKLNNDNLNIDNLSQLNKDYDAVFKVDSEKTLVQVK